MAIVSWHFKSHVAMQTLPNSVGQSNNRQWIVLNLALIVKTQRNSTQLKATLKQLALHRHSLDQSDYDNLIQLA